MKLRGLAFGAKAVATWALMLVLAGVVWADDESVILGGGAGGGAIAGSLEIQVIDDITEAPVVGAFVMVGTVPAASGWNWGYTGAGGLITIADAGLNGPVAVTAGDDVHSWLTLFDCDASQVVMSLSPRLRDAPTSTVSGDVTGINITNGDQWYNFGIVSRTLDFQQILTFNFDAILGPEVVRTVRNPLTGEDILFDVPGNIYAPNQYEWLLIFRVFLEMTPYYLPLATGEYHKTFAFVGRAPRDELFDVMLSENPDITQVAAMLDSTDVGLTDEFLVPGDMTKNVPLTNTVSPTITAHLDHFPADTDIYVGAVADLDQLQGNGELILSGFAATVGGLGPENLSLDTVNPDATHIPAYDSLAVAVAMGQTGTAGAGAITSQVDRGLVDRNADAYLNTPFDFLTDLAQAGRVFSFSDPGNATSPAADLVRGSFFIKNSATDLREYLWDVMTPGGETSFLLPVPPAAVTEPFRAPIAGESARFEVGVSALTFGAAFDYNAFDFDDYLAKATHFSQRDLAYSTPLGVVLKLFLHGIFDGQENSAAAYVTVELYVDPGDPAPAYSLPGVAVASDGNAVLDLTAAGVASGDYYVVIRHLNHVDLMTAAPVHLDAGLSAAVDFTDPVGVQCGASTLYQVSGVWTMPAGDIVPDDRVSLSDFNYLRTHWTETDPACDLDQDGFCRLGDFNKLRQTWNTQGCAP